MQTMSTTEVARSIGQVSLDVQREPVTMTRRSHPVAVVLSFAEFGRLMEIADEVADRFRDIGKCYECGDSATMWSEPLAVPGRNGGTRPARMPTCIRHRSGPD